jgi:hypothetical protein
MLKYIRGTQTTTKNKLGSYKRLVGDLKVGVTFYNISHKLSRGSDVCYANATSELCVGFLPLHHPWILILGPHAQ